MSTTARGYIQDLPPKEGFRPIQTERVPLRTLLGGRGAIGLSIFCTVVGHYWYFIEWKRIKREYIEMRSAEFALTPLLMAERDRAFLKQIKRNVAEEKELMKYYPGWEVGTYFGVPIYKTVREDEFIEPDTTEYFAHADPTAKEWKSILKLTS